MSLKIGDFCRGKCRDWLREKDFEELRNFIVDFPKTLDAVGNFTSDEIEEFKDTVSELNMMRIDLSHIMIMFYYQQIDRSLTEDYVRDFFTCLRKLDSIIGKGINPSSDSKELIKKLQSDEVVGAKTKIKNIKRTM